MNPESNRIGLEGVLEVVDQLPCPQVEALWLVDVCELNYGNGAAVMRVTVAEFACRLHRARLAIRNVVAAEHECLLTSEGVGHRGSEGSGQLVNMGLFDSMGARRSDAEAELLRNVVEMLWRRVHSVRPGIRWPTVNQSSVSMKPTSLVALFLALVLLAVSCSTGDGHDAASDSVGLGHIHDLALDDDGTLLVASHSGLYRVESVDSAVRIGQHHDLMSMTRMDDGELLASGHPNLLDEDLLVEGKPPFFGLARSQDGGENWDDIDLLGEADFHALAPHDDGLFAAESSGQVWAQDLEANWTKLGQVAARDLALDPADPTRQLAPDEEGGVWFSDDGAETWSSLPDTPPLFEVEWVATDLILAATEDGTIWSSPSPTGPWAKVATVSGEVETFYVHADEGWWITVHGGGIVHSADDGSSWTDVYLPPGISTTPDEG